MMQFYGNISNRPVLIWGTGVSGQMVYEWLKKENITVAGFIDNDSTKWEQTFLNLPIYRPEAIEKNIARYPFSTSVNIYPPPPSVYCYWHDVCYRSRKTANLSRV